jgi:aspartate racemase
MRATIGIVGGLGPEGTVHYYRKLARHFSSVPEEGRPGLLIEHVWMDSFASALRAGDEGAVCALLLASLRRLHQAGAEVALLAAVTPHLFLPALKRASPVPLVDIVQATQEEVVAAGHRTVGLLGTRLTLTRPFFKKGLEAAGIRVVVPEEDGVAYLDALIFGPLAAGEKTQAAKDGVAAIVKKMREAASLDAVVVACTDLTDALDAATVVVDPIDCHIRLVARKLAEPRRPSA